MSETINIADPKIVSIQIIECHEPLIDLKNQNLLQYGPPPETDLTKDCYTMLRKTVFKKLCAVQNDLPNGWKIRVYEGYRSRAVQKQLFDQHYAKNLKDFELLSEEKLFYKTTLLVSPIVNLDGSINIPAHNTGGAVDLEIIGPDGKLVDMGMELTAWADVDPDLCQTDCKKISEGVRESRTILLNVMKRHGFVNYPSEWWHFSYGDRYWAHCLKKDYAIYGSADDLL